MSPSLAIGMAVYDDFHGAYFTVQCLRMFHPHVEILIVDNHPSSVHAEMTRGLCANSGAKYIPMESPVGTSAPREAVFAHATADWVMCIDSHVLLWFEAVQKLLDYLPTANEKDMLTGPLVLDSLAEVSTHFEDQWRGQMWGTWGTDDRGKGVNGKPFEIPAMGLGLFVMKRANWVGFNPKFRGFGGEEMYVHEKVRRAGGKVLCLPFLRWVHRFGRPEGPPYVSHLTVWNKVRNYVIGHQELGLPLDRCHKEFVDGGFLAQHHWDQIVAGADDPIGETPATACSPCQGAGSLEEAYKNAASNPSDINEHVPTLRELATGCDTVVEFGHRPAVSSVGLLAGQPKQFISVGLAPSAQADGLAKIAGATAFSFRAGDSRQVEPIPCDLLFIDTKHAADQLYAELDRHAPHCRGRIALHDTVIFGENGEDGGPGLLPAVRRYLADHQEWTVIRHDRNNHGFMVLSRLDADKKQPPSLWQQGWNFLGAVARQAAGGFGTASEEVMEHRLALCMVCPSRNEGVCGECGCPVEKKASWPHEQCPIGHWHQV